jgi:hypothetical protein
MKSKNGNSEMKSKNGNSNKNTNKSNEALITELNELLNEMYKKFLPEDKIPVMGKNSKQIYPNSNVKPVNATNQGQNLKPVITTNQGQNLKPVITTNPVNTTNPGQNLGIVSGGFRKKIIK